MKDSRGAERASRFRALEGTVSNPWKELAPARMVRLHATSKRYASSMAREPLRSLPVPVRRTGPWACAAQLFLPSVCAAFLFLSGAGSAFALEPLTPLADYARQTWLMENGLPQNTVQALTQTRDGFVWLGTEAGLVRFDGTAFQVFDRNSTPALPSGDIRCLLQTRDGALWIGTGAGLARWRGGAVTTFSTRNGLPDNAVVALDEAADGVLWVETEQGLARLAGDRFEASGENPAQAALAVITADGHIGRRLDSAQSDAWTQVVAHSALAPENVEFLASLPGSQQAVAEKSTLVVMRDLRPVQHLMAGQQIPGSRIQAVLADRQGGLWIGTDGGLVRLMAGQLQRFPVTSPLAAESVLSLLEDREGNLWVGTETDGLHILRDQRFRTFGTRDGLSSDRTTAVVEDTAGTIWVGTLEDGLNAMRRNPIASGSGPAWKVRTYTVDTGLASNVILSLAAASNGDLWVGTPDGLNRVRAGRIDTFTSADGLPDDFVRSLLVDGDGSLWIGTRRGLTHWKPSRSTTAPAPMKTFTQASGLGSDLVGALARDARGNLWIATLAGLSRLHGDQDRITNYTTADGLTSNIITALLPRADGTLLIGTQDHGWNVWDGSRFSAAMNNGPEDAAIHAILEDGEEHLWFATDNGIARCDCAGSETRTGCSHWMEFGTADGLRSRETATNSHPSAWRSHDGHLWFATPRGLVEIDPAHFPVNSIPPPVVLERFVVDDVDHPLRGADSRMRIAAGHVHFEFDYAGLSFIAPQKVRYRYILEGFDHTWTDAGARRTAYYTNIPPGHYIFRVQAANNDGVWNTAGASFGFELRPHFYQTVWFYALLLAALGGSVLLLLRQRLRMAQREFGAVLGERSRIAREIHDTLAQGYVGISVQLEVLAELLRSGKADAAAKHLDQTRAQVREGLAEARQSIWALRTQDANEVTLPVRLRRLAEAAEGDGLTAQFSTFGAYRPLPANSEAELLRVAQEAIHNVKKHARATQLSVQLEYGADTIALEVRDNGRGGAVDQVQSAMPGRFGLTGMKERAAAIGGSIEVSGAAGEGTVVRLCAPARREQRGETH